MNIITEPFINNVNLAICIFPSDTLKHDELEDKMMEFTTFYALRFQQLSNDKNPPIDIHQSINIETALYDLSNEYDHVLLIAAGVRIFDMSILFEIKEIIKTNPNYFVAAHVLDWKDKWYELHHQFLLVDTKKWIKAGSPKFGGWVGTTKDLPVIERSVENFHDGYTPLWIKFNGEYKEQFHAKQGWHFIDIAARNDFDIINWPKSIRDKRTYYYPEDNSERFFKGLTTLEIDPKANTNQRNLINQCKSIKDQIWLLNSENMDLELMGEKFDTIALPAAGFKFLDPLFRGNVNENGQLLIYDFNPLSIEWIKYIYDNKEPIEDLIKAFPNKDNFKYFQNKVFGQEGKFTLDFHNSFKITQEYFMGKLNFDKLIDKFRNFSVKFANVDIIQQPTSLVEYFVDKTAINISNIFATDFTNTVFGMKKATEFYKGFLNTLPEGTLVLGQDCYCRNIRKIIESK
jgi:hypothetical protein